MRAQGSAAATDLSTSREVGRNVRAELARRGMSQTEFGARLGLTQNGVSRRLRGVTPWTVVELVIAARALGVSIPYLLGETSEPVEAASA